MNKNIAIAVLVVSTLLFAVLYIGSQVQLAKRPLGATTLFTNALEFANTIEFSSTVDVTGELQAARVVLGGGVLAIGSVATSGPSAAQVCNNAGATLTMTATSGAMTFPEAAALFSDCLESNGKSVFWKISNLGTATTSAQFTAASASTTMVGDVNSPAHDSDLLTGGQSALLEFYRESATKLTIFVSKFADSD